MLKALGTAFGLTFIAELGDKTQLAVLTLSARFGFWPVFAGAAAAFVILNAVAVTLGAVIARVVPELVIRYVSAGIFILFGVLALRPEADGEEEEAEAPAGKRNALLTTFLVVLLMELGDKTQLSLVAMTSRFDSPVAIFIGGTLALVAASALGAIVGKGLAGILPMKWIRFSSGIVFIVFGVLIASGVL